METKEHKAVITRIIDAPREMVFKAWIDPKQLSQWWSPRGFTNPVCEVTPKVGGVIRIHMSHPQFPDHWMVGKFKEIKEPEKLVFQNNAVLGKDGIGEPSLEGTTTVTFEDVNGKTRLTVIAVLHKMAPGMEGAAAGMNEGWNQSIDKLVEFLTSIKN
jgi:uncharacterized protein YndB with AHSA1/START domain